MRSIPPPEAAIVPISCGAPWRRSSRAWRGCRRRDSFPGSGPALGARASPFSRNGRRGDLYFLKCNFRTAKVRYIPRLLERALARAARGSLLVPGILVHGIGSSSRPPSRGPVGLAGAPDRRTGRSAVLKKAWRRRAGGVAAIRGLQRRGQKLEERLLNPASVSARILS